MFDNIVIFDNKKYRKAKEKGTSRIFFYVL